MGCIDGKWAPLIMIILINMSTGMVSALIKKVLDEGVNHMVIATYRLGISTFFLLPIAYFWERKTRPKLTIRISCQLFVSALFGIHHHFSVLVYDFISDYICFFRMSLMQYFYLHGLSYTSATLATAFTAIMPALTFAMALIFRFEKLNMKTKVGFGVVLGTLISLVGALVLTMYKGIPLTHFQEQATISNNHTKYDQNWIKGCLLLLTSATFLSSWMLIQAKINMNYPCQYSSTVILSVFGTIQCALLSLFESRHLEDWILKDKLAIITIIIAVHSYIFSSSLMYRVFSYMCFQLKTNWPLGVVAQGMCTVGISWCIKQRGPVFTASFSPVILMSAILFDFLIYHRMIYLGSVIGSVVVVIGLYIFLWSKSKQIDDSEIAKLPTNMVEQENKEEEDRTNVNKGHLLIIPMTP
ncbi:hypothetical protein AALP_AA6G019000 [Arabis alpina]|uniref:WAT1-related protein n=1 Tax=Arabis alpina TaxID=50452 RepID=A0A087GLH1_ARAAL|nr:hypothetical protein AALP_AA6G019000 [Arabis alpina]